jgi:hypothetical protein
MWLGELGIPARNTESFGVGKVDTHSARRIPRSAGIRRLSSTRLFHIPSRRMPWATAAGVEDLAHPRPSGIYLFGTSVVNSFRATFNRIPCVESRQFFGPEDVGV